MRITLKYISLVLLIIVLGTANTFSQQIDIPVLTHFYIGQNPPDTASQLFAPGNISTNMNKDAGPIFTPDGKKIFWRIGGSPFSTFIYMKYENGSWSQPEIAPFSGQYQDAGLAISPDGKNIFYFKASNKWS